MLSKFSSDSKYETSIPTDERQTEIASALFFIFVSFLYAGVQILSTIDSDFHSWATLTGGITIIAAASDAFFRDSKGLRDAAAGFKRLVLRDEEREEFIEASGLMLGYIMGLPCFAYQPDVNEAIKTLRSKQSSMYAYRMQSSEKISNNPVALQNNDTDFDALGRMLVWMFAPIAAEIMKYGDTVMSDPR